MSLDTRCDETGLRSRPRHLLSQHKQSLDNMGLFPAVPEVPDLPRSPRGVYLRCVPITADAISDRAAISWWYNRDGDTDPI